MCGRFGLNHPHPVLADWYRFAFMPELATPLQYRANDGYPRYKNH